jgi:hypothetical protein
MEVDDWPAWNASLSSAISTTPPAFTITAPACWKSPALHSQLKFERFGQAR